MPDSVKIEFSVRSLKDPSAKRNMNSLLFTHFPNDNYLEEDYEIMRAEMIYGEPPSFEEIIIEVQGLQEVINNVS